MARREEVQQILDFIAASRALDDVLTSAGAVIPIGCAAELVRWRELLVKVVRLRAK